MHEGKGFWIYQLHLGENRNAGEKAASRNFFCNLYGSVHACTYKYIHMATIQKSYEYIPIRTRNRGYDRYQQNMYWICGVKREAWESRPVCTGPRVHVHPRYEQKVAEKKKGMIDERQ